MKNALEDILSKKPHLEGPLRFYEKAARFMDAVKELAVPFRPDQTAYPPELAPRILDCFSVALELPEGFLSPLCRALELGEIDFTRLPLGETPAFSLPYAEDDLAMLLFLLCRPYFFGLRDACRLDGRQWDEGKCPVCGAQTALVSIAQDGRRRLHCSFCGAVGYGQRTQCPVCLSQDQAQLNIYAFPGEEGFSVHACDACKAYAKNADAGLLAGTTPDLVDLISLPLDIVVQQKGYVRRSPNPLGMVRMSVSG